MTTKKKAEPEKKAAAKKFGPARCEATLEDRQCKLDAGHEGMHDSYPDERGVSKSWD